nr:translation initiation factor IF-2-like [Rhipicephalus microplus]
MPPSTARPSQAQGPAAKGPAIPGGNATVTPNPGVAPAAAPATAVGAVPTSYGPAFAVGQTAQPASANSFTIGPGPGFAVAEIGASRGVPTVGTGAPMPFSPVLESALFADSEGDEEPDYELSDTTILDVNPCLLLPLSGCNFFFIAGAQFNFMKEFHNQKISAAASYAKKSNAGKSLYFNALFPKTERISSVFSKSD